jgi:hypothetical protein
MVGLIVVVDVTMTTLSVAPSEAADDGVATGTFAPVDVGALLSSNEKLIKLPPFKSAC